MKHVVLILAMMTSPAWAGETSPVSAASPPSKEASKVTTPLPATAPALPPTACLTLAELQAFVNVQLAQQTKNNAEQALNAQNNVPDAVRAFDKVRRMMGQK